MKGAIIREERVTRSAGTRRWATLALLALIVCAGVFVVATGLYRELSLATVVRRRAAIDAFVAGHPGAAFVAFVALYIGVIVLSIPGAAVLTVSGGLLFGPFVGAVGAFIGATTGASIAFLITRSALGGWLVKRAGPFAEKLAGGFRRGAFNYLLFLRLIPLFPFWIVNIVPAVLGVRFAVFVCATAIGIIPVTFAFALFGAGLDSAIAAQGAAHENCVAAAHDACPAEFDLRQALTPELIAALALIALLSLVPLVVKRRRARDGGMPDKPGEETSARADRLRAHGGTWKKP